MALFLLPTFAVTSFGRLWASAQRRVTPSRPSGCRCCFRTTLWKTRTSGRTSTSSRRSKSSLEKSKKILRKSSHEREDERKAINTSKSGNFGRKFANSQTQACSGYYSKNFLLSVQTKTVSTVSKQDRHVTIGQSEPYSDMIMMLNFRSLLTLGDKNTYHLVENTNLFQKGKYTVWMTFCLTGLDLTTLFMQHKQSSGSK